MTIRHRGNSGRRYTPTAMIGAELAAVRVVVHGTGLAYLPSVTFELRAAAATDYGLAIIEAAALARAGDTAHRHIGEPVTAANGRQYLARPSRGRVSLAVFDPDGHRVLGSLSDHMTADDATAYGLALVEAAAQAKLAYAASQTAEETAA